jgi:hypothetical protein
VCACRSISTRLFRSPRCTIFFCIFSTRTSRTDSLARRIRANFLFCVARTKHFRTLCVRLPVGSDRILSLILLNSFSAHLFHAQIWYGDAHSLRAAALSFCGRSTNSSARAVLACRREAPQPFHSSHFTLSPCIISMHRFSPGVHAGCAHAPFRARFGAPTALHSSCSPACAQRSYLLTHTVTHTLRPSLPRADSEQQRAIVILLFTSEVSFSLLRAPTLSLAVFALVSAQRSNSLTHLTSHSQCTPFPPAVAVRERTHAWLTHNLRW